MQSIHMKPSDKLPLQKSSNSTTTTITAVTTISTARMPPTTPPTSPAPMLPDGIKNEQKGSHKFNGAAKKEGEGE